jgi:nitrite reductase/ring-hydroxylating ferredoxin subunit
MERKEFMKSIGQGAAFTLTFSCLSSCLEAEDGLADQALIPDANGVLFTIDLSSSEGQSLKSPGDYIIKNTVVIAVNKQGNYVAATQVCSHKTLKQVIFRNDEFYCTEHGARFTQQGMGLNSDASKGLLIYPTTLQDQILSILAPK